MEDFKGEIRSIKVYGDDFWTFYNKQTKKVQGRILWAIRLVRDIPIVPEKYLKHLTGTDALYELRISSGSDAFRVFCFFDEEQLIILLNGFQKKSRKTPMQELERAKNLKTQYYEDKAKQTG